MKKPAARAVSLPDDVLLEILFRAKDVPAALFRCATTCKQWRSLAAEPTFLRRCRPDHDAKASSLVGFFTQEYGHEGSFAVPTPFFTPTPRSVLGPGRRPLSSFITAAPAGLLDGAVPLVSRHGLLLVRLHPLDDPDPSILQLAVCDLLAGVCRKLPPLNSRLVFDNSEWNGYAVLTGTDCRSTDDESVLIRSSTSSIFKVVILISSCGDHGSMKCSLRTFSSDDEASWKPVRTFHGILQPNNDGSSCAALVRRGTAHWLFRHHGEECLHIVNLNTQTAQISLTKLPPQMNCYLSRRRCLTVAANGTLSLLRMQEKLTHLEIWEQQHDVDGGSEWICARTIELKQPNPMKKGMELSVSVLGETGGTLLIKGSYKSVYTVGLETGTMEEVVQPCRRL